VLCVSGAAGASTPPSSPPGDATLAGRVTAPDGSPAPGTAVVGFCQGRERVVADGEGHYEIPNLKSGVCTVLARNEARGQRTLSVKIMPGENHLDIALEPLEKRWPLRGRVVDPEGRPVEGAEVENRPEGLTALTSADGSFVLETARTGLDLLARKLGYAPGVLVNRLAEAPTEGLEIRLRKEKIVSGRVTETDGRPVRNALVQGTQAVLWEHQPRLEPPRTMTDEEGRFILRGLPEPDGVAMYLLDVCPKGHELLRLGIRDLPEPAEIEAPVDGKIAGLVVGPDGKPFAGASVTAVQNMLTFAPSPCPSGPRTAITDAKGRFTFEHLGPGLYQFVAKVREYRSYLGAWQIDPGANDKGPTLHLVRELPEELTSPAQR
jgi:uncharacterized GH25 family protein